jgi:hypothetical protein
VRRRLDLTQVKILKPIAETFDLLTQSFGVTLNRIHKLVVKCA